MNTDVNSLQKIRLVGAHGCVPLCTHGRGYGRTPLQGLWDNYSPIFYTISILLR
jgi:hypothetical protein